MGTCSSLPFRIGKADVANESRGLAIANRPAILPRSNSKPLFVTEEHFVETLQNTSCYWVYSRFSEPNFLAQCFYAFDIKEKKYVRLSDYPLDGHSDNASSVLDYNLFVIGGRRGPFVSTRVHLFDPALRDWSDTNNTAVPRRAARAASVDGKVYVFGGYNIPIGEWGEIYNPSTKIWMPIPSSEALADALENGLCPLRASVVLGMKIILRGSRNGIAFDVTSNSWTPVSDNLIKGWWNCTRAAVVRNMLITCHCEYGQHEIFQLSIRAYDPDEDVWLMLDGIDRIFHENAHRSHFMTVNGKLVIYHIWENDDLRYSIIEINERLGATVRANLLWQCRFPIAKILKQGLNFHQGRLPKSVVEHSFHEALRE